MAFWPEMIFPPLNLYNFGNYYIMNIVKTSNTIYKRDSKGSIRVWRYEVGTDGVDWAWRTVAGLQDGKLVESGWTKVEQKNIGKANETSLEQQANLEAEAEMTKKLDRGYFKNEADIDSFEKVKPMLAAKYENAKLEFPVYSQPKLDGIRCIARRDGLWTRQGKEIISVPHIHESLKELFDKNPDLVLDGELYNHDLKDDFNKITSLVRKTKPKPEDIKEAKDLVQYHVYDVVMDAPLTERMDFINELNFKDPIVPVATLKADGQESLDQAYAEYIGDGYEGQMVRTNGVYQQNKRSKFLLKRKEFITAEYLVVGVSEGKGNWSGMIKRFHLVDGHGYPFDAGVRGTQDQMRELFESEKTPEWATLRYFELTPDGVPRFPVVIDYGYGKRED